MGSTRRFKKKQKKQNDGERKPYVAIVRENEGFVKYYKAQGIVPDTDWDKFLNAMKSDLPTAFRITGSSREGSKRLLDIVKGEFFAKLIGGGEEIKDPFCLPWYPEGLGWQLEISRKDIRRSENLFRLHNFLTSETATGAISRQEAVSMIPPLVLDVRPQHKVLDMCAAPGSKTAQLIELLHSDEGIPEGFVMANDIDNSRCYMLVHQAKRLNSPCVMVTNHDSGALPRMDTAPDGEALKFDRILCDVPCCGDGTLRKNPDIWQKWNTANGNNLHGVQYRILKRGLELLELGGRIVYSTCSLNPVEDEAVICRVLAETKGSVELCDISDRLPGLVYTKGLTKWFPASKDLVLYERYEEVDEKWRTTVRPSMFPPSAESSSQFNIDRCVRILPHEQDTGGFFVSVLAKTSPLPWESQTRAEAAETSGTSGAPGADTKRGPARKRRRLLGYREDPYVFFGEKEPVWDEMRDFYGIEGLDPKCLLTRCATGKKKNVYFVSPVLRSLIVNNQTRIKIINTGVKVFARCDNKAMGCSFRLVQEGLESIKSFIGPKRRIVVSKEELIEILKRSDPTAPLDVTSLAKETQERLQDLGPGSCVLDHTSDVSLSMVGWKGTRSLRAYVAASEIVHYLRILGADVSMFEVNKFRKEEVKEGIGEGAKDLADGTKQDGTAE